MEKILFDTEAGGSFLTAREESSQNGVIATTEVAGSNAGSNASAALESTRSIKTITASGET